MLGIHSTDMHGFISGSVVVERDDPLKTKRIVMGTSGFSKDDHIQLDSERSEWVFARDFKLA